MKDRVAIAFLLAVTFAWVFGPIWLLPGHVFGSEFIAHDLAYQLHLNDQLLAGKHLYSEVFSQYGPASAFLNLGVVRVFGNTARVFMTLQGILALICVVQIYLLLRRTLSAWPAALLIVILFLPWLPSPAPGFGAFLAPYGGLERIVLLCLALSWRRPQERSGFANLGLGLLLGSLPWIKFGGSFVAGAALLIADGVDLWLTQPRDRAEWRKLLGGYGLTFFGFFVCQALLCLYIIATVPWPISKDVLWPFYMVANYAGYVTADNRFLHWQNRGYFIGAQLPLLVAALALICGIAVLRRTDRPVAANTARFGSFIFLFAFWCLGLSGYFAHVWLIFGYTWLLMAAAAGAFALLSWRWKLVLICGCLPCFFVTVRQFAANPGDIQPVTFSNGETLWLDAAWRNRVRQLESILPLHCGGAQRKAVIAYPTGAGVAHYLGFPTLMRHSWFMAGCVRPYDEPSLGESLSATGAVVAFLGKPVDQPSPDINSWGSGLIFSSSLTMAIQNRMEPPIRIDSATWIFPLH